MKCRRHETPRSWIRVLVIAAVLIAVGALTPAGLAQAPVRGGVLRWGVEAEPPTLDPHWTTVSVTAQIANHIFETLFTLDKDGNPLPHLVDRFTVSPDGRVYTLDLRRDVRFHNGRLMTSEDVVASISRWGRVTAAGKTVFTSVRSVEAEGANRVIIRLTERYGPLLIALANPFRSIPAVMPAEIVREAGEGQVQRFIGSGPFQFTERIPDRHIRLTRFANYAARSDSPNGYGGRRVAYVDEIRIIPVPEQPTRVSGLETGLYDFANDVNPDMYPRFRANPNFQIFMAHVGWPIAMFNKKEGLFTDRTMRQAFLAALNMEPLMRVAFGQPAFYRLTPSLMPQGAWYSEVGKEQYNQANPERARTLLRQAGYTGKPVRWITTQAYEWMYRIAAGARPQLEAVGFALDLQVLDWATLAQRRANPALWDVFSTGVVNAAEPTDDVYFSANWPGWWVDERKEGLLKQLGQTLDYRQRYKLWEDFQKHWWQEVPAINFGHYSTMRMGASRVRGYANLRMPFFWNVWLAAR
ncbi:MAG: ABC transporter substrate-binding protein [Armatimonadetes bacterium]|nr:ABC transporter substrate-binding protein [Armatimonadota bacterium]